MYNTLSFILGEFKKSQIQVTSATLWLIENIIDTTTLNRAPCKTLGIYITLQYSQQRIVNFCSQLPLFAEKDGILRQTYPASLIVRDF